MISSSIGLQVAVMAVGVLGNFQPHPNHHPPVPEVDLNQNSRVGLLE
jgi:hypothetical protein